MTEFQQTPALVRSVLEFALEWYGCSAEEIRNGLRQRWASSYTNRPSLLNFSSTSISAPDISLAFLMVNTASRRAAIIQRADSPKVLPGHDLHMSGTQSLDHSWSESAPPAKPPNKGRLVFLTQHTILVNETLWSEFVWIRELGRISSHSPVKIGSASKV